MRMRSIASRLLPGLIIGVCFAANAAETPSKNSKEVRLTPFVLGAASSKVKRHVAPNTEREALAKKRVVRAGVIEMELPEDRMVNLVAVPGPDGRMRVVHEGQAPRSEEMK